MLKHYFAVLIEACQERSSAQAPIFKVTYSHRDVTEAVLIQTECYDFSQNVISHLKAWQLVWW